MKHWTRFLNDAPPILFKEVSARVEQRHGEINAYLDKIKKLESEIERIEDEAFQQLRDGGWSTEEIAEAKAKAKQENSHR